MLGTSLGSMKISAFVPFVSVLLSPWAKLPDSFPNVVIQTSFRRGFLASFWYLVISSPVVGWMVGLKRCSRSGTAVVWVGIHEVDDRSTEVLQVRDSRELSGQTGGA